MRRTFHLIVCRSERIGERCGWREGKRAGCGGRRRRIELGSEALGLWGASSPNTQEKLAGWSPSARRAAVQLSGTRDTGRGNGADGGSVDGPEKHLLRDVMDGK